MICDSPKLYETAKSLCLNHNIVCIPNCISINKELYQKRAKLYLPLRLLFVGRLSQHDKNLLICPDILKHCLDEGMSVTLSFVGDGPDKYLLDSKIKELGLENFITFHGRKSNVETLEIMRNSHILLMPSFFEGFPLVILEAMSCGCVPIASKLAGITDVVITNGENGYLADIYDIKTFSEPIRELLDNPDKWKTLSQNAFETVFNNFSIDTMHDKYIETMSKGLDNTYHTAKSRTPSIDLSTFKIYSKSPKLIQKIFSFIMHLFVLIN